MPATSESTRETEQAARLQTLLPQWLERVPLYRRAGYPAEGMRANFGVAKALRKLPLITKADLRQDFPANFLGPDASVDSLVERNLLEVEHTSGTSEERTALLLGRGWWTEQESVALHLNALTAKVLDENPAARRCTLNSPVCNNDICYTNTPDHDERIVGHALFLSLSPASFFVDGGRAFPHGRRSVGLETAFPRRGPGLCGRVRAVLRTQRDSPPDPPLYSYQLRISQHGAPADSRARFSSAGF